MQRSIRSSMQRSIRSFDAAAWLLASLVAAAAQGISPMPGIGGVVPPAFGNTYSLFTYMTPAQIATSQAGVNTSDISTAITNWIAACPATGCELVVPPGYFYSATCNFTLPNSFTMVGGGSRSLDGTQWGTVFACGALNVPHFTVTAKQWFFDRLAFVQVGGTAVSGSSAVLISSADINGTGSFGLNWQADGYYDTIDLLTFQAIGIPSGNIQNSVHYGIRIRNTNADAGDFNIGGTVTVWPANGAITGISYEAGGGGNFSPGLTIQPNAGSIMNCINANFGATTSTQVKIVGLKCEGISGAGITITNTNWLAFLIEGNIIRTNSATDPAINLNGVQRAKIGPNTLIGNGGAAAIVCTTCANVSIDPQTIAGFATATSVFSSTGSSNLLNVVPVQTRFQDTIFSNSTASLVSSLNSFNTIFNAYYALTNGQMALVYAGGAGTFDACIGRIISVDRFILSSTSTDTSCNRTPGLVWDPNGGVTFGTATAPTNLSAGEVAFPKISASGTLPGAGFLKIEAVAGTAGGSCKIIAYAGTSATPVTIVDNVGSGC